MNISQISSQVSQLQPYIISFEPWSDSFGNHGWRKNYNFENSFGAIVIGVDGGKSSIQIIKFNNPEASLILRNESTYYFNRSFNSYTCVDNTIINKMYPNLKNLDYEDCIKILNKILHLNPEGTEICKKTYRQQKLLKIEKEKAKYEETQALLDLLYLLYN